MEAKFKQFYIYRETNVSKETIELIKSLLVMDPNKRFTASLVLKDLEGIIKAEQSLMTDSDLQVKISVFMS